MAKRRRYDGKVDPYVRVIKAMLKEPAWLDLTFGARCLYILLKSYHNGENNGRIYIGVRRAAKELGAGKTSAERWFHELREHGFIRPTQGAFLGLEGKGSATHWRLTEIGYMGEQPSREYKNWRALSGAKPRHQNEDAPSPKG